MSAGVDIYPVSGFVINSQHQSHHPLTFLQDRDLDPHREFMQEEAEELRVEGVSSKSGSP